MLLKLTAIKTNKYNPLVYIIVSIVTDSVNSLPTI